MARRHAEPGTPSVSRAAYFGGLGVGATILIGGYYAVGAFGLAGLGAALAELAMVGAALGIVTLIWKLSVLRNEAADRAFTQSDASHDDSHPADRSPAQLDTAPSAEDRADQA